MKLLLWTAVPVLLVGAAMLVADVGTPGLWIAVIAVSLAVVVIGARSRGTKARR